MPQADIRAHSGTVQRLVGAVDLARFDSTVKVPTEGSGRTSRHAGRRVPVRSLCDGPGLHSAEYRAFRVDRDGRDSGGVASTKGSGACRRRSPSPDSLRSPSSWPRFCRVDPRIGRRAIDDIGTRTRTRIGQPSPPRTIRMNVWVAADAALTAWGEFAVSGNVEVWERSFDTGAAVPGSGRAVRTDQSCAAGSAGL